MKKILLVLVILALCVLQVHAREVGPRKYKGTWRKVSGKVTRQEDIVFSRPAPEVEALTKEVAGVATRYVYFSDGNYYCAYNDAWKDYYVCGANDGSDFSCKYYTYGRIDCTGGNK